MTEDEWLDDFQDGIRLLQECGMERRCASILNFESHLSVWGKPGYKYRARFGFADEDDNLIPFQEWCERLVANRGLGSTLLTMMKGIGHVREDHILDVLASGKWREALGVTNE